MTKKELSQLYWLNKEIEMQQKRIAELENLATSCTATITGMPRSPLVTDRLSNYIAEIVDLRNLLELNLKKCFYELNRLNRYINTIEDSQIRQIMTLRYINGLTWQQIAFRIGEHDEQYPRRKHNAFLRKCKVDENDEANAV
jgi:hypothetical protein